MKKRVLLLLAALVFALAFAAACRRGPAEGEVGDLLVGPILGSNVQTPNMDIDRPFYEFHMWYGYDWYGIRPWAEDTISAHWGDVFNIHIRQTNPDSDAMGTLTLMVTADDMPDAIWMDRNQHSMRLAELGLLVSVNDMKAMVNNTWYDDYVGPDTQRMFEFYGVNYVIPNWARMGSIGVEGGATGGNQGWMITESVWNAVGSPVIRTFEDMFDYAVAVRNAGLTNYMGAPVIPMLTNSQGDFGVGFVNAIYRSMGGVVDQWWYSIIGDGSYGSLLRVPEWREAVLEANRWFREGLYAITNMTQTQDEFRANLNTGRGGLIWYDHSQDEGHGFRRMLREADPGNSIELIHFDYNGRTHLYPPARGLSPDRINHEVHNSLGWNSIFVTTTATRPDRIFEWATWLLTPMGAIEMMYGPSGHLWDRLDHNGFPVIHTAPSVLPDAVYTEMGIWHWTLAGPSNHVDDIKFAVNDSLPEHERSWVETHQAHRYTPRLRLTNEFVIIAQQIEGQSDLGIRRTQIHDRFEELLPLAIMAGSRAEAEAILNDMLAFAEGLGLADIERVYNQQYQANIGMQIGQFTQSNGSIFFPPGR
jgi:ABC-type glycerol-3-phosphate transport system substrate-binding protein